MKTCRTCKKDKDLSDFHKDRNSPGGFRASCKSCVKIRNARPGEDGLTAQQRGRRKIGGDGLTSAQRWYANNPKAVRSSGLKYRYGITSFDFDRLLAGQNGVCAICKTTTEKWCVDHDHKTGEVRGVLCNGCNFALGALGDSPMIVEAALTYLIKHAA